MKFILLNRIVARTVSTTIFCLTTFALGFCLVQISGFFSQAKVEFDNAIQASLPTISENYLLGDLVSMRRGLDSHFRTQHWANAEFKDVQGETLWQPTASAPTATVQPLLGQLFFFQALLAEDVTWKRGQLILERNLNVTLPNQEKVGTLVVSVNITDRWNQFVIQLMYMVSSLLAVTLLFGFIQYWITQRTLSPVLGVMNELKGQAERLGMTFEQNEGEDELATIRLWFGQLSSLWQEASQKAAESARLAALGQLASQIAHDIRSPLAALEAVLRDIHGLPDDKRDVVRSATSRINDIANSLLAKFKGNSGLALGGSQNRSEGQEFFEIQMLYPIIEMALTEKRVQWRDRGDIKIESIFVNECYGVFGKIQSNELKRVLSNCINNAVEACKKSVEVLVEIEEKSEHIHIRIRDNGPGMPADILKKIGPERFTWGKENIAGSGTGLGLSHCYQTLQRWGGKLEIESSTELGGTTVTLMIPKALPPKWFAQTIPVAPNTHLVIVDDDAPIHQLWNERLRPLLPASELNGLQVFHCSSPQEFMDFMEQRTAKSLSNDQLLVLCDHEFSQSELTGIDLIERYHLSSNSILVTSRFEESEVLQRCESLGLKLLPKRFAGFVPIHFVAAVESFDAVLIDDDLLVHQIWDMVAHQHGKKVLKLKDAATAVERLRTLSKATPIYVDYHLADGEDGVTTAETLYRMGFRKISLATGDTPEMFTQDVPWITEVVGKSPPWGL